MVFRNKNLVTIIAVIIIGLLSVSIKANAGQNTEVWSTYGVEPCSGVVTAHAQMTIINGQVTGPPEVWSLMGWISGFATAANSAIGSPVNYFKDMTNVEMVNWVASFCRVNPDKNIDYAMRLLATNYTSF